MGQCWVKKATKSPAKPINEGFSGFCPLFVLHGCRRLGSEIIEDAVDAGNLADDALNKVVDQRIGQVLNSNFHDIGGVDGTDDARPVEGALAVLDACGLEVRNDSKVLPYFQQDRDGWQKGELYMPKILDEEIGPDDTRIQRIIY